MADSEKRRVAIYARVSTGEQNVETQLYELRRYAGERGWAIYDEFVDVGVSGSKPSRPNLDRMMDAARKRKFDTVLVFRFDRFARSTRHLIIALEDFRRLKIAFCSLSENIDTESALGSALFVIVSAIAELERNIIIERVRSGMNRARANGAAIGRPRQFGDEQRGRVLELRASGMSVRRIAARLDIPKSTVANIIKTAQFAAVQKSQPNPPL